MSKVGGWLVQSAVDYAVDYLARNWRTTVVGVGGAILSRIPIFAPRADEILAATVALVAVLAGDVKRKPKPPAPADFAHPVPDVTTQPGQGLDQYKPYDPADW